MVSHALIAWIALNLLLNILMCYFVLQTRPRPNETNMNPYYGPSNVWDLPRDYDDVLAQVDISWRELLVVLVFGNPQRSFVTPINKLIGG